MKISRLYNIPYQALDFVNISIVKDNLLFIDPLKIKRSGTEMGRICYKKIEEFIDNLLQLAKERKYTELLKIVDNLYERNETRLGYSITSSFGKSFGANGGKYLVQALTNNDMIMSGKVEDIFDCMMVLPNIAEDKVSDLITSIIFMDLIKYTQEQCKLWNIPTKRIELKKLCWDHKKSEWVHITKKLPVYNDEPIVFVPKKFAGKSFTFSHKRLYRDAIIPIYKDREKKIRGSKYIVKYKNGRKHVLGNELRKDYPCTKYVIMEFIEQYEEIYRKYKNKIVGE